MAALCIGGVCIPYSAILPLLALGIKWIAAKLAMMGVLPNSIVQNFGLATVVPSSSPTNNCCSKDDNESSSAPATKNATSSTSGQVQTIESVEEWKRLLRGTGWVVAKFTATWCKPCKDISPVYHNMASDYDATFCEIDVDELDDISSEFKVAMMPTFVILKGKETVGTVRGANRGTLEQLLAQHCPRRRK